MSLVPRISTKLDNIGSTSSGSSGVTSVSKSGSTHLTGDVTLSQGTGVTLTQTGNDIAIAASGGGGGSGDVVGPAAATDNALTRYDGTTGKLVQDSNWKLTDNDTLHIPYQAAMNIGDTYGNDTRFLYSGPDSTQLFLGYVAGNTTMTGYNNTGVGFAALAANTSGAVNFAFGYFALASNTSGSSNAAVGGSALQYNTTGLANCGVGGGALLFNSTGNFNLALGGYAGFGYLGDKATTTGSNNMFLGAQSAQGIATATQVNFGSAIGCYSTVSQSDSMVLGGFVGGNPNMQVSTRVGIGFDAPSNILSVSPLQYRDGTIGTGGASSTTITGSGTAWTSAMVDSEIFVEGSGDKRTITAVGGATSLTVSSAVTIADGTAYRIHYPGLQTTSAGKVGIGTTAPTSKLDVNDDRVRVRASKTPSSASDTGTQGEICWDSNYIYTCVATNTWKRAALSTW